MSLSLTPDLAALVGRTLAGRYRILRAIGVGGMGAVFEAEQLDLRRKVAVKVLVGVDPPAIARLRQEAMAAGSLRTANVVTVFDFQANPGEPAFLVMELLAGEPLSAILQRERVIEPARAVRIAVQTLSALDAAHAAGTTHRDIKPSNIWITRALTGEEHVKVLDFGIAQVDPSVASVRTATGVVLGTPAYVAPEQLNGLGAEPRTDVRAVGILLYEMLAGRLPWSTIGPSLFMEILERAPAPLRTVAPAVPPALADIVDRACVKDPAGRFPSAAAMAQALTSTMPPSWSGASGPRLSAPPSWSSPPSTVGAPRSLGPPATALGMPTIPSAASAPAPILATAPHFSAPPAPQVAPLPAASAPQVGARSNSLLYVLLGIAGLLVVLILVGVGAVLYIKGHQDGASARVVDAGPPVAITPAPPATPATATVAPAPVADAGSALAASSRDRPPPGPAPKPGPAKPDSDKCECVWDEGFRKAALCIQPIVDCECHDKSGQLCSTPVTYAPNSTDPDCASVNYKGAADWKDGDACTGYSREPGKRAILPTAGRRKNCTYCAGHRQYPGYHEQPCRGINVNGEWKSGKWWCPRK